MKLQPRVAIDLGAGSGRIFYGTPEHFEEIRRFPNTWDFRETVASVRDGLALLKGEPVASVSCDSWAQDFGLVDASGALSFPPRSYLVDRAEETAAAITAAIPEKELLALCGVKSIDGITTIARWKRLTETSPGEVAAAARLLPVADLMHHALCGCAALDFSLASAGLMLIPGTDRINAPFLLRLGLDERLLPRVCAGPRVVGTIIPGPAAPDFMKGVPVVSGIGHDTAAAFYGSGCGRNDCFISFGSWAMIGTCDEGVPRTGGGSWTFGIVPGQYARFVSCNGMRLLQACVTSWRAKGEWPGFPAFDAAVAASDFPGEFSAESVMIPPEDGDMCREIAAKCSPQPRNMAEIGRAICRSVARSVAEGVRELERESGRHFDRVLVGGGALSDANLMQELRDFLAVPVVASAREAAVRGNLLIQCRGS